MLVSMIGINLLMAWSTEGLLNCAKKESVSDMARLISELNAGFIVS